MRNLKRGSTIVMGGLLGLGLAAGCGGGDSGSSSDVTTGIAPSKLLSDVTAEESASACENLAAGFARVFSGDQLIRSLCTLFSAASTETSAECAQARDACIDQARQSGSDAMMELDLDSIAPDCDGEFSLEACTSGTVGDLESCVNDTLDQLQAALNSVSCDDAGQLEMGDFDSFFSEAGLEPAASCEAIECGDEGPFGP